MLNFRLFFVCLNLFLLLYVVGETYGKYALQRHCTVFKHFATAWDAFHCADLLFFFLLPSLYIFISIVLHNFLLYWDNKIFTVKHPKKNRRKANCVVTNNVEQYQSKVITEQQTIVALTIWHSSYDFILFFYQCHMWIILCLTILHIFLPLRPLPLLLAVE